MSNILTIVVASAPSVRHFFFIFFDRVPTVNINKSRYLPLVSAPNRAQCKYIYLLPLCEPKLRSCFTAFKKVSNYIVYTILLFKIPFAIKYFKFLNRSSKPLRRHSSYDFYAMRCSALSGSLHKLLISGNRVATRGCQTGVALIIYCWLARRT